ncbi:WW domain-containing protein [Mycena venus]|uniref:WW domain-containing protein n=1 Tax=Mycena venus TaxID=2733690 RepID=A0A8H7CZD9_9AGAR|nr:WW domain-containing protein [Mycena venus]
MNSGHPKSPRRAPIHDVPGAAYISPKVAHNHPHSPPTTEALPPGWVKQYDPVSQRHFYVDTAVPRSTWSHPYKDEQYLREHGGRPEKQNIRRHSSASQGIASPVIVGPQRERCANGEPAKKRLKVTSTSPKSAPAAFAHDDFTRELELLLRRDFSFPGKYCHAATTASAANPGLNVKGIGILGLPLSERDAKLVQSLIAASTNVQHPVGNVWELDSSSVECSNPAWSTYLEEIVLKDIWKKLAPHCSRPRLVLQSLLLWEASSDILEYECTESPKRMTDEFATIHVILPSFYTGGHVQLSFSGSSENYDLSATSSFSTSLVAWYHGVDCLIKPVESGRRLALSYRLVGGDEGPRPSLPSMTEKLHELRRFFRKWSDIQEYEPDAAPSIIAYPLLHEYRDNDLRADTLKLEDRHKVIHLKGLSDELGFQLGLATLDDHLIGTADESSNRDGQGRPRMLRVNTRRLTIKEVFDFDGVPPSRTVVVLFERRRTVEALLHTRRTSYALERLYNVDRRRTSPVDRKIVAYVLASLYRQQPYNFSAQTALAEIAIGWNDVKLWNETARSTCPHGSLISALDSLKWLDAWKQFSFEGVRESIEYCCEKKGIQKCLDFFLEADPDAFMSVETGPTLDAVLHWSSEQLRKALDTMQHLERGQAPLFTALIRRKGIQFFWHVVMPSITRVPNAYEFWAEFLRSVYSLRPEHTHNEEDARTFNSLSDEGLDTIISDFSLLVRSGEIATRNRRLSEIIDLCISTRRLDMCRRVLYLTVPRDQGVDWVQDIVSPLYVPNLRRVLHDHSIEVYHKPFTDFFRAVIGCYLQHVLGPFSGELRRICGSCNVCSALDDFMVSPKLTQAHFVGARTHTTHLQTHLMSAADVVSFFSIADTAVVGGNVLIVNKNQDPEADPQWRSRKKRAVEFLLTIGEMPIIDRIMGTRYNDVLLALDGKAHFIHLEDGSRTSNSSPTRRLAIHQLVQGRWVATSLADEHSS